jgi:ligand-binding sensor domain-containing protein
MKTYYLKLPIYCLFALFFSITACNGKEAVSTQKSKRDTFPVGNNTSFQSLNFLEKKETARDYSQQIGRFVREVYQDRMGNYWFGTLEYGIARYDGKDLTYFTTEDGLAGNQINAIAEDKAGNLWLATMDGVSKIDQKSLSGQPVFTNFREEDGLISNSTWILLVDKFDEIWVGTMHGLSHYDGTKFSNFSLPKADVKKPTIHININLIWDIMEDKNGDLWFGRDGLGVCKYNRNFKQTGKEQFTHFTKEEGLCSNSVLHIMEDKKGNIWFGSRSTRVASEDNPYAFRSSDDAGLSRYDGVSFTQFPEIEGLSGSSISPMYEDSKGNIWIASMHHGVFRYNGVEFQNFKENQGFTINCIQSILEDKDGSFWFGFSGGLFKFDGTNFLNMKRNDF